MGYWEERQEAMYRAGEMKVNQYFAKLEKAFNQTKRELQKTVESFYWRYAEENGLTYAAAQQRLNKAEVGELRDYIDLVMQNIGKYNQDVNNMSIKARITRYQALEAQVDAMLRQLYAVDYEAMAEQTMQEVYGDTYYRTWYNIDQYRGFHSAFAQVDPGAVDKLLEYPFNGANFSARLWKQKDHLQTVLMESLTTMMVQVVPPQNLAADFAKKMQSKKFEAYRLLHTESSFLMSEATHAGYKEDDVEKYEIIATLDSKTCGICGELDGKVYPVEEAVTGKNMPPFHCFCRCTDVPHYDDTDMTDMTRAARDADGNPIEVPADMTYKEWKKKYVDKYESSDALKIQIPDEVMNIHGMTEDMRVELEKSIYLMQKRYDIQLGGIGIESLGEKERKTLMLSGPYIENGKLKMALVINKDIDYNNIDRYLNNMYKRGYFASRNIRDVIVHEMAHIMTFQDCETIDEYRAMREIIRSSFVKGVSGYADRTNDGAESLAEAFVRFQNGEKIPIKSKILIKKYITRWKK